MSYPGSRRGPPDTGQTPSGASESHHSEKGKEYFMNKAIEASGESKDPNTKVGAVIVNPDNEIVGSGCNTMPNGCQDLWEKDRLTQGEKKLYVCHPELNAVMNNKCKTPAGLKDCTIYVTMFPCNECAKLIIQSGIKHIVYHPNIKTVRRKQKEKAEKASDPVYWKNKFTISVEMFKVAGIEYKECRVEESGLLDGSDSA